MNKHLEEVTKNYQIPNMVNSTTSKDIYHLQKLPVLATIETTVAVIAVLIIVTSSLVIKNIYDKTNRT